MCNSAIGGCLLKRHPTLIGLSVCDFSGNPDSKLALPKTIRAPAWAEIFFHLCCGPFHKVSKQGGHLTGFFVPFFARTQRFIIVLRKQDMHLAFWDQASEGFS